MDVKVAKPVPDADTLMDDCPAPVNVMLLMSKSLCAVSLASTWMLSLVWVLGFTSAVAELLVTTVRKFAVPALNTVTWSPITEIPLFWNVMVSNVSWSMLVAWVSEGC